MVEAKNKAVALAAEYDTVEALASAQDWTMDRALTDLKLQGVMALVLSEETVGDLIGQGKVSIVSSEFEVAGDKKRMVPMSALMFADVSQASRVEHALRIRFRGAMRNAQRRGNLLALPPVSPTILRATAVGLNPIEAETARKNGMIVIARCANPMGASAATVKDTLKWAHDLGATVFLPEGDQVLGRRDALETTIDTLRQLDMMYATPEFTKIGGDQTVVEKAKDLVIRLHSAQIAELDKLPAIDAVERYGKAARERNMRILLLRPISNSADRPLAAFADFAKEITKQIEKEGGKTGTPRPFKEPGIPRVFFAIFGLALAPVVWASAAVFISNRTARIVGAGLLALVGAACYVKTGQQAMAFFASCAFPILAFAYLDRLRPKGVMTGFIVVSLISLLGGLAVAGMLNGLAYYVKADEFRAIKVSVFLPIVAVGFLFFRSLLDWKSNLTSPITWGAAALGLGLLGAMGIMIARTGNDSGVGASSGETLMRSLLDRFMYVRPRTKEFLFGHPFLIVGIGFLSRFKRGESSHEPLAGWTALMLMIGAMGQSDVVNTLTHLHIPVLLSIARIAEGWVIGGFIGYAAWVVLQNRFKGEAPITA